MSKSGPIGNSRCLQVFRGFSKYLSDSGPVWIIGNLTAKRATTELAGAGYYMVDALNAPYVDAP
tara:strand:+ start:403 stop:594 length:192 start_codon:yes stop_codon:yes gene_type:complete